MVPTKECRVCGSVLPYTEFYRKKSGKYGVDTICKKCARAYAHKNAMCQYEDADRLRRERKELVGERERKPARNCDNCEARYLCEMRVRKGLWTLCEVPDTADYQRAYELGVMI